MTNDITQEPLARALFTTLARSRSANDPLGSLARTVLNGDMGLRAAASVSWHSNALHASFAKSMTRHDALSPGQRAEYERQAHRLREATNHTLPDTEENRQE